MFRSLRTQVAAAIFVVAAAMWSVTPPAAAAEVESRETDWAQMPFEYNVVDQDLRQLFREYGRQLGIIVQLSDNVRGRARNLNADSTAGAFLERLAAAHDLVWYHDGSILHIATTVEVAMQALPTGGIPFDRLSAAVNERSRTDPRLGLRPGPDSNLVYVTGPASYLTFVQETAASLDKVHTTKVRIYRAGKLDES